MKRQSLAEVVAIGAVLVVFALVPLAVGGQNAFRGIERPVMEALETTPPDIATSGIERPVMEALETTPQESTDWAEAWEYFGVVETGTLPEPAKE